MTDSKDFRAAVMSATYPTDLRPFCTDGDAMSGCPCFSIDQPGFRAEGQCWRVPFYGFDDFEGAVPCKHRGCCLHAKGDPEIAARLKSLLDDMDWYGDWALDVGEQRRTRKGERR